MVFKNHDYGSSKKEIRQALYDRLKIRERVRYHSLKLTEYKNKEEKVDVLLKELFEFVDLKKVRKLNGKVYKQTKPKI